MQGAIKQICKMFTARKNENEYQTVQDFKFHGEFETDLIMNGLCLNNVYLPQELILNILSFIDPNELLKLSLVCKKWCNIIKSDALWQDIYNRKEYPKKAKNLPWYVFYSYFTTNNYKNLLLNGNGQEGFKYWNIILNGGNEFTIEKVPAGADLLPLNVPDFNGQTSCFATSYTECRKKQDISLKEKRLLRYILNKFMPEIYASEWVAGRFDCGCIYQLCIIGYGENYTIDRETSENSDVKPYFLKSTKFSEIQWQGKKWEKVEVLVDQYPLNLGTIIFEHRGRDTQFWAGHYGSKMAGGVLKVLFESIKPLPDDQDMKERNIGEAVLEDSTGLSSSSDEIAFFDYVSTEEDYSDEDVD